MSYSAWVGLLYCYQILGTISRLDTGSGTIRMITSSESAHNCVKLDEDEEGNMGDSLSKDIIAVSGKALEDRFQLHWPPHPPSHGEATVSTFLHGTEGSR